MRQSGAGSYESRELAELVRQYGDPKGYETRYGPVCAFAHPPIIQLDGACERPSERNCGSCSTRIRRDVANRSGANGPTT
ncbi:hypothetical protein VARIO8X_110103 [Burkholderiales bacterium 8X]|nr:hypothetical protein VARIO8X_110103 [Burkholderiales bacterium 8X]